MPPVLNVYASPRQARPEELKGGTVVVIDVLRTSTTIVHALQAGAREVIPCLEVEDALAEASSLPATRVVLGGERQGLPIEGFELGNSPEEYTPRTVRGRTVVFTTTNGTRAIHRCGRASRVLIGAFVNVGAIARELSGSRAIHLVCAGTRGEFSRDDTLMAGLLVARLRYRAGTPYRLNAQAITAWENWTASFRGPEDAGTEVPTAESVASRLERSLGGRHLVALGLQKDILAAAQIDRFPIVPELDIQRFRIRVAQPRPEYGSFE